MLNIFFGMMYNDCEGSETMALPETIMIELKALSPDAQKQVLDFTLFLKEKQQKELHAMMDVIITENLPAFEELAK